MGVSGSKANKSFEHPYKCYPCDFIFLHYGVRTARGDLPHDQRCPKCNQLQAWPVDPQLYQQSFAGKKQ